MNNDVWQFGKGLISVSMVRKGDTSLLIEPLVKPMVVGDSHTKDEIELDPERAPLEFKFDSAASVGVLIDALVEIQENVYQMELKRDTIRIIGDGVSS